ncbi:MAG: Gfo/Idh/MocA family protein [Chloroflexota bacterium]
MTDANEPVRWGLLGTGYINRKLLAGARRTGDVSVVAVGSRTDARARQFAAANGIPRAHGSYEALLADPEVEALYISLPNSLHHPWTMRSLAAGKHVLCEKPYSRRPRDVIEAFDSADHRGLVLSEGFMWRHHPHVRTLLDLMPEIGSLESIRATFAFDLDDPDDIRLRPDLDGGSLMDVGCYCVSAARLVTGEEPDVVFGFSEQSDSGVDERFSGLLHFPTGVTAQFFSGFNVDHGGLEVVGSDRTIGLHDPWHGVEPILVDGVEVKKLEPANPYQLELEDMSRAIRTGSKPMLGRADALGQARTIEALYRSADSGAPVRL